MWRCVWWFPTFRKTCLHSERSGWPIIIFGHIPNTCAVDSYPVKCPWFTATRVVPSLVLSFIVMLVARFAAIRSPFVQLQMAAMTWCLPARVAVLEKAFRALPRSDSRNVDIFGENWVRQLGRRLNPCWGRELVSAPRAIGKASCFGLNWALIAVTVCRILGRRGMRDPKECTFNLQKWNINRFYRVTQKNGNFWKTPQNWGNPRKKKMHVWFTEMKY